MKNTFINFVIDTENLVAEFLKKLYEYTYGNGWYKMKEENLQPEDYDAIRCIKFLAFESSMHGGKKYPVHEAFMKVHVNGETLNDSREFNDYVKNLRECIGFRNINHHRAGENDGVMNLLSFRYKFIGCYLAILEPFCHIEELSYDRENKISHFDKLVGMAEKLH